MNELFGLSMNVIMLVLLGLFAICVGAFVGVFLANRVMFRVGLRNLRRRRAQSALIVAGLMLATVIITAAFTTGDVVNYSASKETYDNLQRTDLSVHHFDYAAEDKEDGYAPESFTKQLEAAFAGDPAVEGFMPFLYESVPVLNPRTRLSEPNVRAAGYDAERLARLGGLTLTNGRPADLAGLGADQIFLGKHTAGELDAQVGDVIAVYTTLGETRLTVAGIVRDERASGTLEFGAGGMSNMALRMETLQRITGHEGEITTVNIALKGGARGSMANEPAVHARFDEILASTEQLASLGFTDGVFQVERIKKESLDAAELAASVFTSVFLLLGLFSIAAGAMLIFTLFVMLAAERRTEMGIARAVGAQRGHLVQSFVSEGMVYDLIAGVIGTVLGVIAALVIVVGGVKLVVGDELGFIAPHVAPRSLIVSFCLGVVLTFFTVVASSVQVSQLNIVAAVRGQAAGRDGPARRGRISVPWLVAGVVALPFVPPLGLWWILRKGLSLPWSRIVAPLAVLAGVVFILIGISTKLAFFYTSGISLVILAGAAVAIRVGVRPRLGWSIGGAALAAYWLAPEDPSAEIFGEFEGSMEMFVLSGIMIVTGFTLLIVFNARLLTTVFAAQRRGAQRYATPAVLGVGAIASAVGGTVWRDAVDGLGQLLFLLTVFCALFGALSFASVRFPRFSPALKMAVAYPLANRFRTGMTIAMFSLVVFSITVMGIINGSFLQMFVGEDGRGGWDLLAFANPNNPIDDLRAALRDEGSFDPAQIRDIGRVTSFDNEAQEVRTPGGDWEEFPIIAGDDGFWVAARMKLEGRAKGYDSDAAVFAAVRSGGPLAIVDSSVTQQAGFGGMGIRVDVDIKNATFEPFVLELQDKVSGRTVRVTVIGVLSGQIPSNLMYGLLTNEATYRPLFGDPDYTTIYARLQPGVDAEAAAKGIKAALVTRGVQAISIKEAIEEVMALSRGFLRIFQAFMGLGLFVGIASLGVIALRSVVERRQQIGMLRAIGYHRSTVALSFLLESGFTALMGILSGVVGAALLSWNLLRADWFGGSSNIEFYIPWSEVATYTLLAFVFAMLMTWWPSRRAASVPIADALRYE